MGRAAASGALVVVLSALGGLAAGCGGSDVKAEGPTGKNVERRDTTLAREGCKESGRVEALRARTGNGKEVHVKKVFDGGGHETCRVTDLDLDGRADLYEYFGPSGQVRRREATYDGSDQPTSVEIFDQGRRVRRDLDTTGMRKVDTWDYFEVASGKRQRRERDLNGDGIIDQWWTWENDKLTVSSAKQDGMLDPNATIVIGGAAAPAAPPSGPAPSTLSAPVDAGATTPAVVAPPTPMASAAPPAEEAADAGAKPKKAAEKKKGDKTK